MALEDDGDLIRAYGFVAIRFATLEEGVEDRLRQAAPLLPNVTKKSLDELLGFWFSDRIQVLRKVIKWATMNGPDFPDKGDELQRAERGLSGCLEAAKERNDTLHSPIIADLKTGEVIRNSRVHGYRVVESAEVYQLANAIADLDSEVARMRYPLNSILGLPRFT